MLNTELQAALQWNERYAAQSVEQLTELLRIPSVSAQSNHNADTRRAAEYVRDRLKAAGLQTELCETPGHPIVYAEWLGAPGAPTVMVYGHYDVQPPDPLDKWDSPPFEPVVRKGNIYARGATDDKGQMFTHVRSVASWLKTAGHLPVNVKFVIEGEEEVGSNHLDLWLEANKERCQNDIAVVSDTSQYGPGMPAITYGLRGIIACEVVLHGPGKDLHSGVFGGAVANPSNALAHIVGQLHDEHGHVQIPGFYDDVGELTPEERAEWSRLPFDQAKFLAEVGSSDVWGEAGFTTLERRWARPTCDVNGMLSGYTGEGPKTIIPSWAMAKITCRLVPNQDAHKVVAALRQFVEARLRPGIRLEFKEYHGCPATVCDLTSPYMAAAKRAIERGFGKAPVLIREGGSIPVVGTFKKILGVDTLLLGWGQNTDNLHSPNEKFSLEDYQRGIRASTCLWWELAGK
ncbi:MAG: dipeptidase [Planctomycetota bacterium]|jgi:acetylornithine deacetylase/succinyl-diaminopimelate desuccinylase-like protein|nr:MAG: dipeptidase [Planctomycetota bacterium]